MTNTSIYKPTPNINGKLMMGVFFIAMACSMAFNALYALTGAQAAGLGMVLMTASVAIVIIADWVKGIAFANMRARHPIRSIILLTIGLSCGAFSIIAALGNSVSMTEQRVEGRKKTMGSASTLKSELRTARAKLDRLGRFIPLHIAKAEYNAAYTAVNQPRYKNGKSVWQSTEQCENATLRRSQRYCSAWKAASKVKDTAIEAARLEVKIGDLTQKINKAPPAPKSANPTGEGIAYVAGLMGLKGVKADKTLKPLALLPVIILELLSCFGRLMAGWVGTPVVNNKRPIPNLDVDQNKLWATFANDNDEVVSFTYRELSDDSGVNLRHIRENLEALQAHGLIEILQTSKGLGSKARKLVA